MGTVLSVLNLVKTYEVRKSAFALKKQTIRAVDGVSFVVEEGRTIGIVGESGSGKSTLARCVLLLEIPDAGSINFRGADLLGLGKEVLRGMRRDMQIIFQDPYSSLNPRKKVFEAMAEPLLFHGLADKSNLKEKVLLLLRRVGLDEDFLNKYPYEMSGGQRQRVAIGRALATDPALIVADEPVSSLDVSIQAQIINLFIELKELSGFSMIFVSHDLNVVRFVSDNIIVMYGGKVLESGTKDEVFTNPWHPYTRMLMSASVDDFSERLSEDTASAEEGCVYFSRCEGRQGRCAGECPTLRGDGTHQVACFGGGSDKCH